MKLFSLLTAFFILVSFKMSAQQQQELSPCYISYSSIKDFPQPVGWVNDFEKVFTTSEAEKLDSLLSNYYQETLNPIAVVTVNSIAPYARIQDFSTDLGYHWGISKNRNNGLIIVLSRSLNQVWVKPGAKTQKKLTESVCHNIIERDMQPFLKNNDHFNGVIQGIQACIKEWK
jgi:uncharacterized protein